MSCCTEWPSEQDSELHDFYARKLLNPGWAGVLSLKEAHYIAHNLKRDAKLRRRWAFRKRKRYPLLLIAQRAQPEEPQQARRNMISQMASARSLSNRLSTRNRVSQQ